MQAKNLIIFLSDNHAGSVMGCAGHPLVRTPNIDALAAGGTRFGSAYTASPICCPSRASIATGRYPHATGYWDNVLAYDGKVPSWMRRLRDAGVEVASIGKLHYRGGDDYGFSEEILPMHLHAGQGATRNLLRGYDAEPEKDDSAWYDMYADSSGAGDTSYQKYDRDITAAARDWLARHQDSTRPWVLLVSWVSPHPPFTVPQRLLDLYPADFMPLPPGWQGPGWADHPAYRHLRRLEKVPGAIDPKVLRRIASAYFGLITHLDEQIGEVMAAARGLDLLDDTRLLYTSDHGELFGAHGLLGKRVFYEQSVGVPMVLSGPDVPAGQRCDTAVSHVDLFPTVLEALGVPLAEADRDLPGRSLLELAQAPVVPGAPPRPAFAEFHAHGSPAGAFMLRAGRFKLIYHVGLRSQLFDLENDPDELTDLGDDPHYIHIQAELKGLLLDICDPEKADAAAKAAQRARVEELGGRTVVRSGNVILFSPPPGEALEHRVKALV